MTSTTRPTTSTPDDVAELAELIRVGGFWRLAPTWVPRDGYADPHTVDLRRMKTGLRRLIP
ncbi:hypothetical protein [Streptomyces sp. ADMS]|uniref:hypothetical protein n=1 Tax=Streptomyces sp. ADMS TaxID=3071415 RepID=UPI00296E46B8|nr:hypothetical protein [Streptomyces sp. ADMS]